MNQNWSSTNSKNLIKLLEDETNPIVVCSLICELTKRKVRDNNILELLKIKSNLHDSFWNNFKISDFAIASLHLLNFEPYKGNRIEIKKLIQSNLTF